MTFYREMCFPSQFLGHMVSLLSSFLIDCHGETHKETAAKGKGPKRAKSQERVKDHAGLRRLLLARLLVVAICPVSCVLSCVSQSEVVI